MFILIPHLDIFPSIVFLEKEKEKKKKRVE